jgi:ribulose 1,5-bisphosphate carboxylase large subunit-like protein
MTTLKNIIGGNIVLTEDYWALSLVRKENADHAYLILEGVEQGERFIRDAHLVIKEDGNDKKADIIYREISIQKLQEVGANCSSYTWNISKPQAEALINLIQSEQQRAQNNEINYVLMGQSKLNNVFAHSAQSLNTEAHSANNASIDMLTREGHNCHSWAIAMVRTIGLKFANHWTSFIAVIPRLEVQGTHYADEPEPDTKCLVM